MTREPEKHRITIIRVEAADGLRRVPDRVAAAHDDPVDVEGDAEGRPHRRRPGVGQAAGEIQRSTVIRGLELHPRLHRCAYQPKVEAPHAINSGGEGGRQGAREARGGWGRTRRRFCGST